MIIPDKFRGGRSLIVVNEGCRHHYPHAAQFTDITTDSVYYYSDYPFPFHRISGRLTYETGFGVSGDKVYMKLFPEDTSILDTVFFSSVDTNYPLPSAHPRTGGQFDFYLPTSEVCQRWMNPGVHTDLRYKLYTRCGLNHYLELYEDEIPRDCNGMSAPYYGP